jgi:hypothetical protein
MCTDTEILSTKVLELVREVVQPVAEGAMAADE